MTWLLAALVVQELMIDPVASADADGEWIEIVNDGASAVDLSGWRLLSSGDSGYSFPPLGAPKVPGAGLVVLGRSTVLNGGAPVSWAYGAGVLLSDDSDVVDLVRPDGTTEMRVEYGAGWPHVPGRSLSLASLDLDPALPASWCAAEGTFGAGDRGTPNAPNDCAPESPPDAGPAPDAGVGPILVLGKVETGGPAGCNCASGPSALPLVLLGLGGLRRRMLPG